MEASSSTIWCLHMKLVLHSTLRMLHVICRAGWGLSVALSEACFIILKRCCQTFLAWRLVSFHTENRKWQDGVQRGGTAHLTTGGRDCNRRNVNVSISTCTEAAERKGFTWCLEYAHVWNVNKVWGTKTDKVQEKVQVIAECCYKNCNFQNSV